MSRRALPIARHGFKLEYRNSQTGGPPLPTIGAYLQLLPHGFDGRRTARPTRTVFCAVEGHGTTRIGDKTFSWGPRDVFVVPSWHAVSHSAAEESVLFSFSDRPAQKALGIWREGD